MNTHTLRPALLTNAAFSAANGLLLALSPAMIVSWLGPGTPELYLLLGSGLILFSVTLTGFSARPTALAVLAISGADAIWVIGTTAALLIWRHEFSPLGYALVLGTNTVVGTLMWFQLRSIREAFRTRSGAPDEYQVCVAMDTPATADAFWRVLADLGSIHRYSPALRSSALAVGEKSGVGCVRTCENTKGEAWSERCDEWEEGTSFSVSFLTDRPGFPFPFSKIRGGWRVAPNATGCRVEVWWRVVPRHAWAAAVVLPLMAAGAQRSFGRVIARMSDAARQGGPVEHAGHPARLRATLC